MSLRILCSLLNCGPVSLPSQTISNIFGHGTREEEDILLNSRDLRTQRIKVPVTHIYAIDEHAPTIDIIDTIDQFCHGALASSGLSNDSNRLSRLGSKREILQYRSVAITEGNMIKDNIA